MLLLCTSLFCTLTEAQYALLDSEATADSLLLVLQETLLLSTSLLCTLTEAQYALSLFTGAASLSEAAVLADALLTSLSFVLSDAAILAA